MAGSFEGFRSLSDIDLSTAANDSRPSTSFSARKNPPRIPANTPPVFPGLRPRIWSHLLRLVTNGNVGQAPCEKNQSHSAHKQLRTSNRQLLPRPIRHVLQHLFRGNGLDTMSWGMIPTSPQLLAISQACLSGSFGLSGLSCLFG